MRITRLAVLAYMLLGCSVAAGPVFAQTRPDSVQAVLDAVTRLKIFEHQHSILVRAPGARFLPSRNPVFGYCEVIVGDYCYGPDNGGIALGGFGTSVGSRILEKTNFARVFQKRSESYITRLLTDLKKQRRRIPGDRWLNGEIVRIEVERMNLIGAMESLDDCKAEAWWCGALRAYVIHTAGVWLRADSSWNSVLAAMPESERCAWLDPTWVINDRDVHRAFREADCAGKLRLAERAWWLSDPLYLVDGNERRSEHLARTVELILTQEYRSRARMTPVMILRAKPRPLDKPMVVSPTATPFELEPEVDVSADPVDITTLGPLVFFRHGYPDLVMRVGPPKFTIREEGTGALVAQYPTTRAAFVPDGAAILNPSAATPETWEVMNPGAFEFMSSWVRPVLDIDFQLAWFRRGDSARFAAATDVRSDTLLGRFSFDAGVFLQRDYDQPATSQKSTGSGLLRFAFQAPAESTLVSVELRGPGGAIGRARTASGPQSMQASGLALSDLLLTDGPALASDLDAAERLMRGSTRVDRGRVGLFWEVYGLRAGATPKVRVSAVPDRPGLLARVARSVTLQGATDSLSVEWEESPALGRDIEPRSVNLDLGSLVPGGYTLSLHVEVDGAVAVSRRRVEVR